MDTLSSQVRSSSQVNQDGSSSELMTPEKARVWLDCMRPMLLAMAKEMIGPDLQSKFGASDIVQQTYVDAIGDLPRLNLSRKRQLIGWLTVLLRNNMRDAARTFRSSLKRAVARESADQDVSALQSRFCDADSRLLTQEQIEQLFVAMNRLPAPHQQVLQWRFFDDLSYAQIAERVDRKEDAVRMMVQRCLTRLRQDLYENGSTER
jgi:RNA polymerase sigma-70 factor (ECF subfamily)